MLTLRLWLSSNSVIVAKEKSRDCNHYKFYYKTQEKIIMIIIIMVQVLLNYNDYFLRFIFLLKNIISWVKNIKIINLRSWWDCKDLKKNFGIFHVFLQDLEVYNVVNLKKNNKKIIIYSPWKNIWMLFKLILYSFYIYNLLN